MQTHQSIALDPATLSAFAARLSGLPKEEIRKAKSLYVRNSLSDLRMMLKSTRAFLWVMGVMSLIPIFLVVFIPAFLSYRALKQNGIEKIRNALEVWRSDLQGDYDELLAQVNKI